MTDSVADGQSITEAGSDSQGKAVTRASIIEVLEQALLLPSPITL